MKCCITTIEDVKAFAKYLTNDLHLNFHPDDDFSFYVNYETKEPTFSPEEAAKYNALMNECFDTRVRDKILKSKEQKTIQPTKGGHKMVTYQNYVSLFYCQITSCPSDGGIS